MAWEGAAKLAAILLVLFVQEVLARNQVSVLGIPSDSFYEIIVFIVQRSPGVMRNDLMSALDEVDQERLHGGVGALPRVRSAVVHR